MKNNKLNWIIAVVPLIIAVAVYNKLPVEFPYHWNYDGTVTYGSKNMVWLLASLPLMMSVLFYALPKIDPRKANYEKFGNYYDIFIITLNLFLTGLLIVSIIEAISPGSVEMNLIVTLFVGVLFIIIGNMMPKFKSNFFMGIKTPWTLSSENIWNRTHRLGGILFVAGGLVMMVGALIFSPKILMYLIIVIATIIVVFPTLMSYIWYTQEQKEKN